MKKKILIIDDSALMRRVMCDIINLDSRFEANDFSKNGEEGLQRLLEIQYDAVVLDMNMPKMNGLELLEILQLKNIKLPIIMVSTSVNVDQKVMDSAKELGVVDFVQKPTNFIEARGEVFKDNLIKQLVKVTEGKVRFSRPVATTESPVRPRNLFEERGRRTFESRSETSLERHTERVMERTPVTPEQGHGKILDEKPLGPRADKKIIAIASSTGGPKALHSVIPFISENIDAPIVIVQHMPVGFTKLLAERLDDVSKLRVKEAEHGETLQKGHVYIAPGGAHMSVVSGRGGVHQIRISYEPPIDALRPCANVMYESLMDCMFDEVTCVVLTGMGSDGTLGINHLKKVKRIYVVAQNEETCAVYGMPKAVYESGAVNEVVPLANVAKSITKNVGVR